jgi:hypothetical protein
MDEDMDLTFKLPDGPFTTTKADPQITRGEIFVISNYPNPGHIVFYNPDDPEPKSNQE